jgi:hypothetical protein
MTKHHERTFHELCLVAFLARFSYALARNPVLPLFAMFLGAGPEAIGLAVGISTVASSLARTGKEYREVHEWIDNAETKYERHDFSKVLVNAAMFREKYGEEAAQEYVEHLVDDLRCRFGKQLASHQTAMPDCLKYFGG